MLVVVVGNVTGAQGRAIVERFQEFNRRAPRNSENSPRTIVRVRGLTRDAKSAKARDLLRDKEHLELYTVDFDDASTFEEPFRGADALFLNVIMSKTEGQQYKLMIDAALKFGTVRHIIYSSSAECQLDHGVPHWETSWGTEQQLRKLQQDNRELTCHVLRYAHCNDNMLTFYKPSKDGWMAFPWDPSVRVHTASVRDGARVACKLFLDPSLLPPGGTIDITTDFCSPREMAAAVSEAKGRTVRAYKGPWIFLNVISRLAYEPRSIKIMGEFIERHWTKDMIKEADKIQDFLKDEIESGEPLESVQEFCQRHFASGVPI